MLLIKVLDEILADRVKIDQQCHGVAKANAETSSKTTATSTN